MQKLTLDWINPLDFASKIADNYTNQNWIFRYSGLSEQVPGSISQIALFAQEEIISDNFSEAQNIIQNSDDEWLGYLSYELGQNFETLPKTQKSFISLPKIHFINFGLKFEFNHDKKELIASFHDKKLLDEVLCYKKRSSKTPQNSNIISIDSNFSDQSYLAAISNIKEMIANGDLYQTNLTRKFFGEFEAKQEQRSSFKMFCDLCELSPANYSSFLKLDDHYIISSSPELFLKVENGKIISRPIKGTTPRSSDPKQDEANKLALQNSEKEKAENLMIVDLVRNDLSRICQAGSIVTHNLFDITSYQNIHHMSSEVEGSILDRFSTFDAIKTCFPPGSMTGAPKIKAINVATDKEQLDRGIYSGAIGSISNEALNLSVVIRTLVLHGKKFEFQVGGAITFGSDPEMELQEIFNKARGILALLQIDVDQNIG